MTLIKGIAVPLALLGQAWSFQPNIIFIVCDDYGWMDVGFHGSEITTPHLDQLASEGIQLEQHYVQPVCTPTRSSILTGVFPIHSGLQVKRRRAFATF